MRHRLIVHIVWTTRNRLPLIDAEVAGYLAAHLPRIASEERAQILEIGIVSTHLHLLVRINPNTSIPRLLQRFKGGTAAGANQRQPGARELLRWAKGYSIASVSERAMDAVATYVRNQAHHHPREAIPSWPPETVASAT